MNLRKPLSLLALLVVSSSANASNSDHWETFSDIGAYGLIGVAILAPAYKEDWEGFREAGYSIVSASGATLLLKTMINEERPDKSGTDSFPSHHTASAFAAATTLTVRYGREIGVPAYGIATLVGIGRVRGGRHYWKDVIAGSVIGTLAGWVCTDALGDDVEVTLWAASDEAGLTALIRW